MLTSELTSVVRGTANNIFGCVDTYIKIGYDNFLIIYYYTHTESLNMIYILSFLYSAISDAMSKVASAASTTSSSSMRNISNKSDNSPKKCKPDTVGGKSSSDANSGCGTPTATSESSNTNTRGEKSAKCKCYFLHPSISEK